MRKFCFLFALIVFSTYTFSQTVYPDRRDGEIYFKFNNDYKLSVTNDEVGNVPLSQFEFINDLIRKYEVTNVQRSFYFAKELVLRQTFRIYFNKANEVDAFIRDLAKLPYIEYAEHVPLLKPVLTPTDLGANSVSNGRWHLYTISAREAWDISTGSTNIKVAIVDDAVQTNHPDLAANMLPGRDVALGTNDPNPPTTAYSHGTHVAGCASAVTNNGTTGIASIGFNTKIIPVKATNSPSSVSNGYEGVTWASNNGANVINMSWGSTFGGTTGNNVVNAAFNSGKTLVAAAGNDGASTVFYPAGYTNVIAVAATGSTDAKASFSNFGNWITISAPGTSIRSTVPTNTYAIQQGTSMASPIVAGLCGLILSVNPAFTPTQVRNCLTSSADNINAVNSNFVGQLGAGRINAYQALLCAQGTVVQFDAGISAINTPSGSSCNGTFTPQVVLKNFGSSTLTSVTIQYRIDNGTLNTFNWTGSLASQATVNVNLPSQTTTNGPHTFTANTTATLNGNQTDANANNNSRINNFTVFGAPGLSLPFTESFESGSFTTNNWTVDNPDNGLTWEVITTGGTSPGNKSVRIPFYSYSATTQRDGLITPPLNFTGFDTVKLRFDHAYRRYNQNSTDSLIIYASTNCGTTWTRVFARGENGSGVFATAATSTADFIPAISDDWCLSGSVGTACYTIDLNAFKGNNAVRLKFEGFNNYQNNLYLDNINVIGVQAGVPPVAQFTATPTTVCSGSLVSFTNQSTNQPTSYSWSFPGGSPSSSTSANPSIRYDVAGTYNVSLTAINGNGQNTITKNTYITVNPKPSVTGTTSPQSVCDGDEVILIANGASSYEWSSGLSNFTGNNVPVNIFGNTVYRLVGTAANGCKDTTSVNIQAQPKPVAIVNNDFSICNGAQTTLNASGGSAYQWSDNQSGNFIFVSPAQTTTYVVTVSLAGSSCTDTASVTVTVLPKKLTQIAESFCDGSSYLFNGQVLTQAGSYSALLNASNGCDSLVELTLSALPTASSTVSATICDGETYTFNGQAYTQQGNFPVAFAGANGCDSIVTISLQVNQLPNPTIIQNGNALSTQPFTTYQWQLDGIDIQGANSQTYTATQNGNYTVVVTDGTNCSATSAISNYTGVGITDADMMAIGISVYPNPATSKLYIAFSSSSPIAGDAHLYDYTGKVVLKVKLEGKVTVVDISALAPSVYVLEAAQNGIIARTRITKL